jgi:hypothetical protein
MVLSTGISFVFQIVARQKASAFSWTFESPVMRTLDFPFSFNPMT